MSQTIAIFIVFFAAFLWGSWLQVRKLTGDFPLAVFMVWLYFSSALLVFLVIGVVGLITPLQIADQLAGDPIRAILVLLCGGAMAIGMYLQMKVIDKVGLILSNSVSATFGVLLGTSLSIYLGGLPQNFSIKLVALSVVVLITATFLCQLSGKKRDEELAYKSIEVAVKQDTKAIFLLILSSVLITCYPLGMSIGVKTEFSPNGFSPLVCIGLLALGSFLGILTFCSFPLTIYKEWKFLVSKKYKREIGMTCICGICHYGGNLLHVLSSKVLSTAISWLLGRSGNMWTYLWGIYHKEYQGASKQTYFMLISGIGVYIVGIVLLAQGFYN